MHEEPCVSGGEDSVSLTPFKDRVPSVHPSVFVDPSARILGSVTLREDCSVWPGAVLRGDDDEVDVGAGSVFLDQAFAEAPAGRPVRVGARCLVSHGAKLHGCILHDEVVVGIGVIVLDRAEVGEGSVIGAGALVTPGTTLPPNSLILGVPAKVARTLTSEERAHYQAERLVVVEKAKVYRDAARR